MLFFKINLNSKKKKKTYKTTPFKLKIIQPIISQLNTRNRIRLSVANYLKKKNSIFIYLCIIYYIIIS